MFRRKGELEYFEPSFDTLSEKEAEAWDLKEERIARWARGGGGGGGGGFFRVFFGVFLFFFG